MLTLDQVKAKSAARLSGLNDAVRKAAEALIVLCFDAGVPILITQGLRTVEEQNKLYAQGRTIDGQIVTNARGGYSFHNFGLAVDFALLLPDGSSVSWDMNRDGDGDGRRDWDEVVQIAKSLGFESGGDWTSFKDYPHLQMCFGLSLAELRGGKRPSETVMAKAMALVDKRLEEADEMSEEYEKRIEAMEQALAAQAAEIKSLKATAKELLDHQSLDFVPPYAQEAVKAAVAAGLVNTPEGGSQDFYRILTVLGRAGLLANHKEA